MNYFLIALLWVYLFANGIAFTLFGIDKQKAIKAKRRISEKSLFLSAGILGAVGAWMGMYFFHHKTKKWYFTFFMPIFSVVQIALLVFLISKVT